MALKIGTFNLNNLFSRFNFQAEITDTAQLTTTITFDVTQPNNFAVRKYMGKLVKGKSKKERDLIAQRIRDMDLDILAVQEVEDIDTLSNFIQNDLANLYRYFILIEGNDKRLIDVALLSKLPLGPVTTWKHAVHPDAPNEPVFSRDFVQLTILNATRSKTLLTVFNTHLKSKYVPFGENEAAGEEEANLKRKRQAEMMVKIIDSQMGKNDRYLVCGDFNDTPDSEPIQPLATAANLNLVNGLQQAQEVGKIKNPGNPPPPQTPWTDRFKDTGKPAEYALFDQIWLSPKLAAKQTGAFIGRRKNLTGDGSDHDPSWVTLNL